MKNRLSKNGRLMHRSFIKISFLVWAFVFAGCNSKVMKEAAAPIGQVSKGTPATITFADVKSRVLNSACIRCHSEFQTYKSLMDDVVAGNAAASNLYTNMQNAGGNMPKGAPMIADADAALIRDWINSGAPEFLNAPSQSPTLPVATPTPSPTLPPPASPVYFAEVKAKVFDVKCLRCHGAGSSKGDFTTYASITGFVIPGDFKNSKIVSELQNFGGDMPKGGGTPLDAGQLAVLQAWIEGGAIEKAPALPRPTPAPAPLPAPGVPTFAVIQSQILTPKCVMCHSDARMVSGFSLEHYDSIVANARLIDLKSADQSGLYASVVDDFMPLPSAVAKGTVQVLTAGEKDLLKQWVEAGAPR